MCSGCQAASAALRRAKWRGVPGGKKTRYSTTTRVNTRAFVGLRCYKTRYRVIREVLQRRKGIAFVLLEAVKDLQLR